MKRRLPKSLLLALICGILPLLAGAGAFVWWWWSRSPTSVITGAYVFTVGAVVLVVGALSLIVSLGSFPKQPLSRTVGVALLLTVNVVVAYVFAELVIGEVTTNEFTFINASDVAIEELSLFHGEVFVESAPRIDPGAELTLAFSARDREEGPTSFLAQQGGQRIGGGLQVQVLPTSKVHVRVVCHAEGRYEVHELVFDAGKPKGPERKVSEFTGESEQEPEGEQEPADEPQQDEKP